VYWFNITFTKYHLNLLGTGSGERVLLKKQGATKALHKKHSSAIASRLGQKGAKC